MELTVGKPSHSQDSVRVALLDLTTQRVPFLDTGHSLLVSKGGIWSSPHQASWAGVQMPFAPLLPSGKTVGGAEAFTGSK